MQALAGDAALVVPGRPDDSVLVTQFLKPTRPMGNTLGADAAIIREWIGAGCPIEEPKPAPALDAGGSKRAAAPHDR